MDAITAIIGTSTLGSPGNVGEPLVCSGGRRKIFFKIADVPQVLFASLANNSMNLKVCLKISRVSPRYLARGGQTPVIDRSNFATMRYNS